MSYAPGNYGLPDPIFISPFSRSSVGSKYRGQALTQPTSGTLTSNGAIYVPFYLARPYDLQRFWWQNGATVGTDSLMAAIYTVDGSDTLDCLVSTARTLSAGTINQLQFATCAVQAHGITSGTSTTDGTSFVTASVTLKARPGVMYAVIFANSKASAANVATSVQTTGAAVTFTSRTSQTYGASTEGRVNMWTAVPTSDVTDTITITFGSTQTGCAWTLVAFTNVDTTTDHGIVQTAAGSGNSTTPLATLGALGSTSAGVIGANANVADTTTTPGTNFLELYDINYATPTNCLQVQFATNDASSDGTITSGQWGAIAAEVKNLGTTRTLAPGRYYLVLHISGNTATVFRVLSTAITVHIGTYLQTSLTTGLPLTATLGAGGGALPNFGITSRSTP